MKKKLKLHAMNLIQHLIKILVDSVFRYKIALRYKLDMKFCLLKMRYIIYTLLKVALENFFICLLPVVC